MPALHESNVSGKGSAIDKLNNEDIEEEDEDENSQLCPQ